MGGVVVSAGRRQSTAQKWPSGADRPLSFYINGIVFRYRQELGAHSPWTAAATRGSSTEINWLYFDTT